MLNKKGLVGLTSVFLYLVALNFTNYLYAEHPTEHPQLPFKKQTQQDLNKEFSSNLKDYIQDTLKKTGTLPIKNINGEDFAIPGKLELVRIHEDKIIRYKDNTYFACADFIAKSNQTETNYDLDFFMSKSDGVWKLDRILLHKINSKLQMTYKDNEPVPVEKEAQAKSVSEHP